MNVIVRDTGNYGRVVDFLPGKTLRDMPFDILIKAEQGYYEIEETEDCYSMKFGRWWITECEDADAAAE